MLRQSESFMISILRKLRLLNEDAKDDEELPLLQPLESVDISDPTPTSYSDELNKIAPVSKASRYYQSTKVIHQQLLAGKAAYVAYLKDRQHLRRVLFGSIVPITALGAGLLVFLMVWRHNKLSKYYSDLLELIRRQQARQHAPEINKLNQLLQRQIQRVLAYFNPDEHARVKEMLFGMDMRERINGLHKSFSSLDDRWAIDRILPGLEHVFAYIQEIRFSNLDYHWSRGTELPYIGDRTCWTHGGNYDYKWEKDRMNMIVSVDPRNCENNGTYTMLPHPDSKCYGILKNICDLLHIYLKETPRTVAIHTDYVQAFTTGFKIRGEEIAAANVQVQRDNTEMWILGGICVPVVLLLLAELIYIIVSFVNAKQEHTRDIQTSGRLPVSECLDDHAKQQLKALTENKEELALDIKDETTFDDATKQLKQAARILDQQRFEQFVLFKQSLYGTIIDDMKKEITDRHYEKPDPSRDMPFSEWTTKPAL